MIDRETLEYVLDDLRDGMAAIQRVTSDWKEIGMLPLHSEILAQYIVDPSVPVAETIIDVRYSCGSCARIQLNEPDLAHLFLA